MQQLLALGLVLALAGPALAQTRLVGDIAGLGTCPAEYRYQQQGTSHTDTVRIVNGHFAQVVPASDDGLGILQVADGPRGTTFVRFWTEPGTVRIQGTRQQLARLDATGTPENDVLSAYNHTVQWKNYGVIHTEAEYEALQTRQAQDTRQFIQAHPAARTSAYLLAWQMVTQPDYPAAEYDKLYSLLTPAVRQSPYGQQAAARLGILRHQPTLGQPVPDFSVADTAGVKHSLATYRGRYVLLDFWGHWCQPCVQAIPKLRTLHQQYADNLTIIGLAAESPEQAAMWKRAIRQHAVPGLQLSELQAERGPMMTAYNISSFPTYILLDPQGRLLVRTEELAAIAQKLAALPGL